MQAGDQPFAPLALTVEKVKPDTDGTIPLYSPYSWTVPGACDAWFEAPDLAAQQKLCRDMQAHFWQNPGYVPLGMYDAPMAFHSYLQDVPDGWPQFYGVRRV